WRIVARRTIHAPQRFSIRLVVGGIDDCCSAGLDAITEARRGVVQVLRLHPDLADREFLFSELLKFDLSRDVRDGHREIRVVHLPTDGPWKRAVDTGRPVDRHLTAWGEGRNEKGQAL